MLSSLRSTSIGVVCIMGLAFATTSTHAGEAVSKAGSPQAKSAVKPGKKWETDQALRAGMENIRQAFAASREGIEKQSLKPEDYRRLAEVIERNVADIVKNCRLPKDADVAFHRAVLADLNWGSEMMRTSPKAESQRASALAVMQTLRNYGEYFQHPGWSIDATR